MAEKKFAVVSDIHGNSAAFSEVLKDIKNRGIETIINLGDSLYGPLDPVGTFELLKNNNVLSISGNEDRLIVEKYNECTDSNTLEYVKSQINHEIVSWLQNLSFDHIINDSIYCCHGSPDSDIKYLIEKVTSKYVLIRKRRAINKMLRSVKQKIILCGHSHVPRFIETNKRKIINPGSIGLPAYEDDIPVYHKMECFSSHASYAILSNSSELLNVELVSVLYDSEKSAKLADSNGRADWAKWLRYGRI